MKCRIITLSALFVFALISFDISAQGSVPEILYYQFNQSGATVSNDASSPPAGTASGNIVGLSQGGSGLCGGALIGVEGSSASNIVNTGWNTNLGTSGWTISFWIDQLPNTTALLYQFGDLGASSLRCFNNGVAGAGNFMLRGPVADVTCTGCATVGAPSMVTFVYDPLLGDIRAYHNGVLNNTVSQSALNITGSNFTVGGYSSSTGIGNGQLLDEFRVYDHAIDAQEVFDTYNACLPLLMLNVDAGITDFISPQLPTCSFTGPVSVVIRNFGTDTLTSAQVNWEHNSIPMTPVSWTGSLAQYETDTVVLGTAPLAAGSNLIAYTSIPNSVSEDPAGAINDTTSLLGLQSGLIGVKTVGGVAPDYVDINAAINALTTFGICGPVIFDIRDGVYTDQMDLPQLATMSPVNTVTFRSENGDSALVSIEYASANTGDNYVVNMSNVANYHFENLTLKNLGTTYGRVVTMDGSSLNSFKACRLVASSTTSTSNNSTVLYSIGGTDTNNLFVNNSFEEGSYGVYWQGTGSATPEHGNVFEGNVIKGSYYRGAYLYYNDGIIFKDNEIVGDGAYTGARYALYGGYLTGAPQITGNNIYGTATRGWTYGMYFTQGGGNNGVHAVVANNMIQTGWSGYTSTLYGIYMSNGGYFDIFHNSILCSEGGTVSRAFYATSGGGLELKNNIFANYTGGYAIYLNSVFAVANSDYNVLYAPAGKAGYYGGDQQSLADWQNAASFDLNSIDYNPNFQSTFDLHVCSDSIGNQGTPIAFIPMDIDGHPRSSTAPDMGADEFNGLNGSFLGNDVEVCANDSVQLWAGSPTDTILWSTGETTSSIWVSSPGSYTVSVQGACGSGVDAIIVSASSLNYTGYITASNTSFCSGDSVLLYSTQVADSYLWTGGSVNDSLYITAGGTYTLDITDDCGSGSQAVTVTMNDVPNTSYSHVTNYLTGAFTNTTATGSGATYLWSFGEGNTSTDENPIHVYTNSGFYIVTLTVTNDCGSATFSDTVNFFVAGIEEVADFGTINVSPNPSTGMFNVNLELNEVMNLNMVVTNVMGQVVSTKAIDAASGTESTQIDLSTEAAGVYYLNILSGDKKITNKMLIKK